MAETLDKPLNLRVSGKELEAFTRKASKINRKAPDLIREFMTAFNEDRLQITQPENGIYKNVRN